MRYYINYLGVRFGSLVAVEKTQRILSTGRKMVAWRMVCDCGNEIVAITENLRKGSHKSCGCRYFLWPDGQKPEPDPKIDRRKLPRPKTGLSHWPEYKVFSQMKNRCYLATAPNYKFYGALGIRVCDRWRFGDGKLTGFQCFIEDMGRRPDGLTLDRIDPFGHYEPANCRWATWEVQASNKRRRAA